MPTRTPAMGFNSWVQFGRHFNGFAVQDVWQEARHTRLQGAFSREVAAHDTVLLIVTRQPGSSRSLLKTEHDATAGGGRYQPMQGFRGVTAASWVIQAARPLLLLLTLWHQSLPAAAVGSRTNHDGASSNSDPATTPWQQDVFVISALDAPPDGIPGAYSGTMDLGRRYAQLRAANFTVVLGQEATGVTPSQPFGNTEEILALAEAHDLRVILLPLVSIGQDVSVAAQLARSLTNSTSRALLGWHIADEPPDVAHFRTLKLWKNMIDAHRPGKVSYVNLLPNSCVHFSPGPWGYSGYDGGPQSYMQQFIDIMDPPQVLSFDLYPFFEAPDSGAMPTATCPHACDNCANATGLPGSPTSAPTCCCCNCTRSGYRRSLTSHRLASLRLGGVPSWVYFNILPCE